MKSKLLVLLFSSILFFMIRVDGIFCHESEASIQIDLNVVSNYVWRGHDFFRNYAIQNYKSFGPHTGTWAFQPSITWNTPVDGLYVNLFSSLALAGRNDKDIDKRIQNQPAGPFIENRNSLLDYVFDPSLDSTVDYFNNINTIITKITSTGRPFLISDYQIFPNFYKEPVGLRRSDELDITIGYEADTKIGIIGFGILHYSYVNHLSVAKPYGTEVFISYALPILKPLRFTIYEDLQVHTIYYNVSYGGEYNLTKEITSNYNLGLGYYVFDNLQGISDITLNYTISHNSGFSIGFNIAYRPDLKIQDYYFGSGDLITGELLNTTLPVELNGQSSIYDGKVADPSRTLGPLNESINSQISSIISNNLGISYSYTPRQSLPQYLWWISLGYSITIK